MKRNRILVLGACGQLGAALTKALIKKGGRKGVIAADVFPADEWMSGHVPFFCVEWLDKYRLRAIIGMQEISQIYMVLEPDRLGAFYSRDNLWQVYTQGLLNVLEIATEFTLDKVFWSSSISVFGEPGRKAICTQHCSMEPLNISGISMAAGEHWCRYFHANYGLDVRSLRLPVVFGDAPGERESIRDFPLEFIRTALSGKPYTFPLSRSTRFPALYLPDAVRAIVQLMEAPANKIRIRGGYNIGSISFSPFEFAGAVRKYFPSQKVNYKSDARQKVVDTWPEDVDYSDATKQWGYSPAFNMEKMVIDMVTKVSLSMGMNEKQVAEILLSLVRSAKVRY